MRKLEVFKPILQQSWGGIHFPRQTSNTPGALCLIHTFLNSREGGQEPTSLRTERKTINTSSPSWGTRLGERARGQRQLWFGIGRPTVPLSYTKLAPELQTRDAEQQQAQFLWEHCTLYPASEESLVGFFAFICIVSILLHPWKPNIKHTQPKQWLSPMKHRAVSFLEQELKKSVTALPKCVRFYFLSKKLLLKTLPVQLFTCRKWSFLSSCKQGRHLSSSHTMQVFQFTYHFTSWVEPGQFLSSLRILTHRSQNKNNKKIC